MIWSHYVYKVLVIGGGDGGVLREVVKHDTVDEVTLVDIDEAVPRVSKKYLPNMAIGFEHPKATVHIGDGLEFLKDKVNMYDVIITDSSDPDGKLYWYVIKWWLTVLLSL